MTARDRGKERETYRCEIVGGIASPADLRLALEMPEPPDLFEVRLDHFAGAEAELENALPNVRAPLIITARHPAEGGANNLSGARRRELIARFLPRAGYLDFE